MAIPTEPVGSLPRLVKLQAAIAAYDAGVTDSQKLSARDATKRQIGSCARHEDSPTRLGWSTMPKTTVRWANLPRRDRVERRLAAILAADVVGLRCYAAGASARLESPTSGTGALACRRMFAIRSSISLSN